ncbi:MAG: phosphate acetyltransferase, partial [Gemmobacter sp.]|nr:phosphate acetyltransferase [Gemmobacter sp.]
MIDLGTSATQIRSLSPAEIAAYHALIGTPGLAETVPEPMVAALISCLLGMQLPGPGTNYLKQDLRFMTAAPANTPLTVTVTVTRLRPEKHLADLATSVHLPSGQAVCEG